MTSNPWLFWSSSPPQAIAREKKPSDIFIGVAPSVGDPRENVDKVIWICNPPLPTQEISGEVKLHGLLYTVC